MTFHICTIRRPMTHLDLPHQWVHPDARPTWTCEYQTLWECPYCDNLWMVINPPLPTIPGGNGPWPTN